MEPTLFEPLRKASTTSQTPNQAQFGLVRSNSFHFGTEPHPNSHPWKEACKPAYLFLWVRGGVVVGVRTPSRVRKSPWGSIEGGRSGASKKYGVGSGFVCRFRFSSRSKCQFRFSKFEVGTTNRIVVVVGGLGGILGGAGGARLSFGLEDLLVVGDEAGSELFALSTDPDVLFSDVWENGRTESAA